MCSTRVQIVLVLLGISAVTAFVHREAEASNVRLMHKRAATDRRSDSYLNSNSGDYSSYSDHYRPGDHYGRNGMDQFGRNGRMPSYGYDRSSGSGLSLDMNMREGSSQGTRYMGR